MIGETDGQTQTPGHYQHNNTAFFTSSTNEIIRFHIRLEMH